MPAQPQDRKAAKKTTSRRAPARVSPPSGGEDKYAATTWGSGANGEYLEDLEVPSGQLCLVRRPGVEGLLKAGVLHDLDTLTQLVNTKLQPGKQTTVTEAELTELISDPAKFDNLLRVVDKVTCYVVVKPEIHTTPDDVTRRENGVIYADMVDLMDKLFILNFAVGGTRDLERFHNEHADGVGALDTFQSNAQASKRASARTR